MEGRRRRQGRSDEGLLVRAIVLAFKNLKPFVGWMAVLLLLVYLASGIRSVGPGESGLLITFGCVSEKIYTPGIVFGLPEPFAELVRVPTGIDHTIDLQAWQSQGKKIGDPDRIYIPTDSEVEAFMAIHGGIAPPVRKVETNGATTLDPVLDGYTLTADHNIVQASLGLRYRIAEPVRYYMLGERRASLFGAVLYQAATRCIARRGIDDCLTSGRERLVEDIRREAQGMAARLGLGIDVVACELRELGPPKQVIAAFEDVINAQMFARTLLENAQSYRVRGMQEATGRAQSVRRRAESFANDLLAKSKGESSAFVAYQEQYEKSPGTMINRLYLETLDEVMRNSNSAALFSGDGVTPTLFIEPSPKY